jgi:hypothetical protein
VVADHIVVNPETSKCFTLQMIGEGSVFRALQKCAQFRKLIEMDPELSLGWLTYMKKARNPDYVDIILPPLASLKTQLETIETEVIQGTTIINDAHVQVIEASMESGHSGESLLMTSDNNVKSNGNVVAGLINLVEASKAEAHANATNENDVNDIDDDDIDEMDDDELMSVADEAATAVDADINDSYFNDDDELMSDAVMQPPVAAAADNTIVIENQPLNEFTENDQIFASLFPMEFVLGVPKKYRKGSMPTFLLRRLLLSVYPRFERCRDFNFYVFNQQMRHANCKAAAFTVSDSSGKAWNELLQKSDLDAMCKRAIANPDGKDAIELRKVMLPLVRTTSRKVNWSPGKRASQLPLLYGMCQRRGLPSDFLTISQASWQHPLVIKLGSRRLDEDAKKLVVMGTRSGTTP